MSVELQAYLLHAKPYRETSMLVEFFSLECGRLSAVAKGIRKSKSSRKLLLQPFNSLLISLAGKSQLKTLIHLDHQGQYARLQGNVLISGLYLNELLYRLLPRNDPHPELFFQYQLTLNSFASPHSLEVSLRLFEKTLLSELGYGLSLKNEVMSGDPILPDKHYLFSPLQGFSLCRDVFQIENRSAVFLGEHLLKFHDSDLSNAETLASAKRLMRIAIMGLLDGKALRTRELFGASLLS